MCGWSSDGDRAGFALEALAHLRAGRDGLLDDLQRDQALQARVAGFVDLAHAAGANRRQDSRTGRGGCRETETWARARQYR